MPVFVKPIHSFVCKIAMPPVKAVGHMEELIDTPDTDEPAQPMLTVKPVLFVQRDGEAGKAIMVIASLLLTVVITPGETGTPLVVIS